MFIYIISFVVSKCKCKFGWEPRSRFQMNLLINSGSDKWFNDNTKSSLWGRRCPYVETYFTPASSNNIWVPSSYQALCLTLEIEKIGKTLVVDYTQGFMFSISHLLNIYCA